ncbi:MAG: hypothetical protein AAGF31_07060 [Planctomycetota bacterium]
MLRLTRQLAAYIAMLMCCVAFGIASADTVTLRPLTRGDRPYSVEGTITDYRGDKVTIKSGRGVTKTYPAGRVLEIDTTWPAEYVAAQQAIEEKAWQTAAKQLTNVIRSEQRAWARRWLVADLLRCRLALGQWEQAGELLIALDTSDPTTRAWSLAPLPWFAADDITPSDARAWLDRPEESARLLGAAWLLTTPEQRLARGELRSLARSKRPAIASLAECQLWRLDLVQADARQTDRWEDRLQAIPAHLQAGPQHLLAHVYLRQKRYDDAALIALQAPLTGVAPHRLSARGLLLAAKALSAASHDEEAQVLLEEITTEYADTPQRQDAAALLARIEN